MRPPRDEAGSSRLASARLKLYQLDEALWVWLTSRGSAAGPSRLAATCIKRHYLRTLQASESNGVLEPVCSKPLLGGSPCESLAFLIVLVQDGVEFLRLHTLDHSLDVTIVAAIVGIVVRIALAAILLYEGSYFLA